MGRATDLNRLLFEEYVKLVRDPYAGKGTPPVPVFKNPSAKEMREAGGMMGAIRFTADSKTKTLYVWDHSLIHHHATKGIGYSYYEYGADYVLSGTAICNAGGRYSMSGSDTLKPNLKASEVFKKFKWVEKWIDIKYYLHTMLK